MRSQYRVTNRVLCLTDLLLLLIIIISIKYLWNYTFPLKVGSDRKVKRQERTSLKYGKSPKIGLTVLQMNSTSEHLVIVPKA